MFERLKGTLWPLVLFLFIFVSQSRADTPKPAHFGVFLVDGKKLIEIKAQDVNQKNLVGYLTVVFIGLKEIKDHTVASESAYFIIYGQEQKIGDWKISRLKYHEKYSDAMIRPVPFDVDMWLPDSQIPCVAGAIRDLADCFTLTPRSLLNEGNYVLHFHSLEPLKHVGVVDDIVYPFAVGGELPKKKVSIKIGEIPVYTISFLPKNPNIYFLGSANCIYQKTSEGHKKIEAGRLKGSFSLLSVNPDNTQNLFAGSKSAKAMVSSSDGGTNWKEVLQLGVLDFMGNPYTLRFNAYKFDIKNPDIISIAATGTKADGTKEGIFRASINGGENWDIIKIQDGEVYDVISNGDAIFFSTDKAIYRLRIEKKKAEKIIDSPQKVKHLIISLAAKEKIFGATSDGKIYVSENNGQSFTFLSDVKKNIRDIAVDHKSTKTLWFITDKEVYKTNDAGVNWSRIEVKELSAREIFCLAINPENSNVYIGTSKGLYITKDGGISWIKEE